MAMTLQSFFRTRLVSLYLFLFCVSLLGIAMYMEHVMYLEPCPLCIMQRIFFLGVGLVSLLAFLHGPRRTGQRVYGLLAALFAIGGGSFAIRQIYLQNLPKDEIPVCGPGIYYMMQEFPLADTLKTMITGDGNCAEIMWQDPVLNWSIPQWSLVGFVLLTGVCIFQALRR